MIPTRKLYVRGWQRSPEGEAAMVAALSKYGEIARMDAHSFLQQGYAFVIYYDLRAAMRAVEQGNGDGMRIHYHDKPELQTRNVDDDAVMVNSGGRDGVWHTREGIRNACADAFGPIRWMSDRRPYLIRFWDVRHAREAHTHGTIYVDGDARHPLRVTFYHARPMRQSPGPSRSRSRSLSPHRRRPRSRSRSRSRSAPRRPRHHRSPSPVRAAPAPPPAPAPNVVAEIMAQNQLLMAMIQQQRATAAAPAPVPAGTDLRDALLAAILGAPRPHDPRIK